MAKHSQTCSMSPSAIPRNCASNPSGLPYWRLRAIWVCLAFTAISTWKWTTSVDKLTKTRKGMSNDTCLCIAVKQNLLKCADILIMAATRHKWRWCGANNTTKLTILSRWRRDAHQTSTVDLMGSPCEPVAWRNRAKSLPESRPMYQNERRNMWDARGQTARTRRSES